jgi:tetratricopeptide (TPR) repeat protein
MADTVIEANLLIILLCTALPRKEIIMFPRYAVYLWLGMAIAILCVLGPAAAQGPAAKHAARTIQDITQLLDQYKPDPERLARLMAAVKAEPPAGDDSAVLARFYHERSHAAEALGQERQGLEDLEKALPYAQRAKLPATPLGGDERRIVTELANAWTRFDYRKAIAYAERDLANPEFQMGYFLGDNAIIADIYTALGDFASAEKLIARAEARLKRAHDEKLWGL